MEVGGGDGLPHNRRDSMTQKEKQQAIDAAVKAAIKSLQDGWDDWSETQHFAITVHNQDQTLFADGGITTCKGGGLLIDNPQWEKE
jgi:hypothetical protein